MSIRQDNVLLSPLVRIFAAFVLLVVAGGSISLLADVDTVREHWPWMLTPFNTRFLAAVYLAEVVATGYLLVTNRWSPARLALPVAGVFTGLVTLVSLTDTGMFDFGRKAPWAWLVLYGGSAVIVAYFLWKYRHLPFRDADADRLPPPWRMYLLVQGALEILYGLAMMVAPGTVTDFWPWPIDDFHGRVYSTVFIAVGIGVLLLSRMTSPLDWQLLGFSQAVFGVFSIVGLILVDADTNRIDWSAAGTWVWIALFGWLALAGLAMAARGLPVLRLGAAGDGTAPAATG